MKTHKIGENMTEDTRIALLEQSIGHINEALLRIEKRFDKIDERFEKLDIRFDRVENKLDRLNSKIDSRFMWLLSFTIGGFAGLFGIMSHAMHWL